MVVEEEDGRRFLTATDASELAVSLGMQNPTEFDMPSVEDARAWLEKHEGDSFKVEGEFFDGSMNKSESPLFKKAYSVEDREDKDRADVVIDSFGTLEEAETFAREWSADYGSCAIYDAEGTKIKSVDVNSEFKVNLDEIRQRAADSFADGVSLNEGAARLGQEPEFVVDNVKEFMFSNNIVSGDLLSTRDEEALFDSLTEDEQAEIERTVRTEMEAQGWVD